MNKNIKRIIVLLSVVLAGLSANLYAHNNTNTACPTITVSLVKKVNATCHGSANGMAIVTASGGVAPYTYSWSPSGGTKDTASGLAAATYTVTATDHNGCTGTLRVTVTQPAVLSASISSVTEAACNGSSTGIARSAVSGGTAPYTYSWSPSGGVGANAYTLAAGTYTVSVNDKNGCGPVTAVATITQPASSVSGTYTSTNVTCNGGSNGSANVTASGGTPGYTYSWTSGKGTNPSIIGLTAGTYVCTIKDKNGCVYNVSVTITQPAVITATQGITKPTCGSSNGVATATVSGGTSPYTYAWSPSGGTNSSATSLAAGVYTLNITDSKGCTGSSVYYISNSNLTATATFTNVTCYNSANGKATYTVTGGATPYAYSWSSGQTTSSITGLIPAFYTVSVKDKNGCSAFSHGFITQPSQFRDSIAASTNELCNGASTGTARVGVKGGTTPYTYTWSPSGGTTAMASNLGAATYTVTVNDKNGCGPLTSAVTITQPASALTAPITSSSSPLCNGNTNGDAVVTAGGGTSPYTYSWSPSGGTKATASNLASGTYTCTVKDKNACTVTSTVTLVNPSVVSASVTSSTNPSCSGSGSATVTASGGTGTLKYSWAPTGGTSATASSLSAGTYTCTVSDANSCTTTATVTLTSPSSLSATISSSTNPTCSSSSNGSATVSGSGGVPPYHYTWSTGATTSTITGLANGTYSVLLTDAGSCTAVTSVTLATTAVSASISSSTNPLCNGGSTGSATATAVGGNPGYTYSWAPSGGATATNITAGNYTVTATDTHGCTGTATVTLTDPPLLSASIASSVNPLCNGTFNGSEIVTGTGGTGSYTYSWSPNTSTSDTATGLNAGTYTATVTDVNGCTANASATLVNPPVLNANITSSANPLCNGGSTGSATVTASGGTPSYTYIWTPSGETTAAATGLAAGSYTVDVSDNNGCENSATVTLTDPAAVIATISAASNPKCNGSSDGSASVTASGGTGTLTYNWTPSGGTNASASGLSAGSYTCTVTDGNGCTTSAMVSLTNPTAISASVTSSTNPLCNGNSNGSATVTASGGTGTLTYAWTPSGGTNTAASGLAAGSYTCTVTDANGCTATPTVTLTDPAAVTASITSSSNPLCNGSSNGSVTVTVGGGTGTYTYAWTPSGGTGATASGLASGSYTCTVTDAHGCTVTTTTTLTDPATVSGTIVSSNPKCNNGSDGSATVTASGGNGVYTYSWTPSGGTNSTANGLSAGSYTVTITDGNSCTGTATVTLTNPTAVSVSITSSSNPLCNGSSNGSATALASGGTGTVTYAWASSGGTNAIANNLAAGTYTITATDGNGCTATNTVTLTDPALLTASAVGTNPLCSGSSTGSATVTASGGTGTDTYAWTPSGGTNANATSLAAGSYTCTVTDVNGCSTTATVTLTDPAALTATITSSTDPTCSVGGSATVLAGGGTGADTYTWSPSGGTNTVANGLLAGTYTATVTDANGCTATATVALTNPSAPTITFSVTNELCNGNTNGSVVATVTGGTPAYTYSWAPASSTTNTISGVAAGSYTLTVTDSKGCSAIGSATVTQPAHLVISAIVTPASCTCNGTGTVIVFGGTSPYAYNWSEGGSSSTINNLCAGSGTITVTDANGCTIDTTYVVTTAPTLSDSIISATEVSCHGGNNGCATQQAIGGTAPYTYSWAPSGNTTANACGLSAGTYTASVTDANGCTATATVTITQPTPIVVSATSISNASCGKSNGSATVLVTGGTPGYIYSWTPSGGTNATASGLIADTYTVTVTDINGCTGNDIVFINDSTTLKAKVDSIKNATCNGMCNGAIYAGASGGNPPYSYTWTPSVTTTATATSLCAGKYNFTVTDSIGCVVSDTATVTQPTPLVVVIDTLPEAGCNAKLWAVVSGGTGPYTYQWTGGVTTDTLHGNCNQEYNVTVTDANGCTVKDSSMVIPTGINELSVTSGINIYPVPTTGNLNVSISEQGLQNAVIMIVDITGREVMEQKVAGNASLVHIDVSTLSNGTYLLKLTDGNILKIARFTVSK